MTVRLRLIISSDYADYEEEETKTAPKRNPFDFSDDDVTFDSAEFVSQSEVKDFFNVSRGITYNDDDDDESSLGQPWGGPQYSIGNVSILSALEIVPLLICLCYLERLPYLRICVKHEVILQ